VIQIKFPGPDPTEGGWVMHELDFVPGKRLQYYLRDVRLIGLAKRSAVREEHSRRPVRMTEALTDETSIVLQPVAKGGVVLWRTRRSTSSCGTPRP